MNSLIDQRGDIHPIFPKKYLQKCGIKESGMYNQIANYVYTQTEINIKIKDQAPKEYMAQVKEQCTGVKGVSGDNRGSACSKPLAMERCKNLLTAYVFMVCLLLNIIGLEI